MRRALRAHEYRVLALLFDLIEGRRDAPEVAAAVRSELRRFDPELDEYLRELEARRPAAAGPRPVEAAGDAAESRPLAPVLRHPGAFRPAAGCPAEEDEDGADGDDLAGDAPADYAPAFAAASAGLPDGTRLAAERDRAERDLRRLLALRTPEEREASIHRSLVGMRSPLLVERLLAESRRLRSAHPRLALELTEAALAVVRRLDPRAHRRSLRFRLLFRAEAHRANALRLIGELRAADSAWRLLAARRTRDPVDLPDEEAELLSLEASLRIDLRQFAAAERLLGSAERLYRSIDDPVGAARVLIQRGSAAEYAGDGERAVELHRRAAELVDPEAEPVLYFMSQKNLAHSQLELGRLAAAEELLAALLPHLDQIDDPVERLRYRWVRARLDRAQSRFSDAERKFIEVRNEWLSLGRPYEAALATLDSTALHLARGDWRQVRRQAELLAPVFDARGVHREARAALILFQRAAAAERLTADFVARLRQYLMLARNDRSYRFDPTAT